MLRLLSLVTLVATSAMAEPLDALGLGPLLARAQLGPWLYVCPSAGGLAIVDLSDPEHPRLAGRALEGRICSRLLLDGENLIALETREEALTLSLADPRQPVIGRLPATSTPVATPANPLVPTVPVTPAAVRASASVLEVAGGRVIFDGGSAEGFAPGMHVRVISQRLIAKPDLVSGGTVQTPSGEVSAVLIVEQVEQHRAMAILGRGDVAEKGDRVERTEEATSERLMFPRRAPFTWRVGFQLRPFLGLEGQSKPVGFLIDGFAAWYAQSIPLSISVNAAPIGFALNAKEGHYPGAFALNGSYTTDYFEIGLGVGALTGNPGPCGADPLSPTTCEANTGFTINQRLRLGALDGFHLEWSSAVFSRPDKFVFGVGRGEVAVPVTSRLGIFGAGGGGESGWAFGELGLRTWVSGAGSPGTLILSASLGYSAIFDGPSREFVAGPSVSFGMEWRL